VEKRDNRRTDAIARTTLVGAMATLCAITWQKWGSLTIDCGHEWYVTAALSRGKRLYFDIWYQYGPLIPYWHSLLFRAFGIHLWLLEAIGILIIGITSMMLYSLSRLFLPAPLAFVAAFAYLVQAFQTGEFNYVLPYSYPAAYGAMMFVILAWLLVRDALDPKRWTFLAAGCIAGLEAITKIEFGLLSFVLLLAAILARALWCRSVAPLVKGIGASLPGLLISCGVYGWYIRAGGLAFLFGENISILPGSYFMKAMGSRWAHITGFVAPPGTVVLCTVSGLLGPIVIGAVIRFAGISRLRATLTATTALLLAGLCPVQIYASVTQDYFHRASVLNLAGFLFFNRGMVLTSAVLLAWMLIGWRRRSFEPYHAGLLLLLTAGILMDSRTIFKTFATGYAVFYDPLVFVGYLVAFWKMATIFQVPESPRLWTGTAVILCSGLVSLTVIYYSAVHTRTFLISSPRGDIYTEPSTGRAFTQALAFLRQAKARSESFAVWPEEAALYYFSDATSPSRWWCLTPGILPTGETTARFLEDLDRHEVKYVALSNRDTPEYGLPTFGIDYNQQVYRWLEQNFQLVRTFGNFERASSHDWAVQIWQRRQALLTP
jgi:hypothetical protein